MWGWGIWIKLVVSNLQLLHLCLEGVLSKSHWPRITSMFWGTNISAKSLFIFPYFVSQKSNGFAWTREWAWLAVRIQLSSGFEYTFSSQAHCNLKIKGWFFPKIKFVYYAILIPPSWLKQFKMSASTNQVNTYSQ